MLDPNGKRLLVEIWLGAADLAALDRYVSEINAMVERDNQMSKSLGLPPCAETWTQEIAVAAMFGSALDRERRLQMVRDNRADDPPWITQIVRDAIAELKAVS